MTEDEMVGWHHRLNGHQFEQTLGDGEGQGSLVCCSPWGCKELDMTKQLNNSIKTICWFSLLFCKEINSEYTLEGLMLKLKLHYFGHLMGRTDSLEKTLMLGRIEGRRRRGQQRMRWLDGITDTMDMNLGKLKEMVVNRDSWHATVHGVTKSQT